MHVVPRGVVTEESASMGDTRSGDIEAVVREEFNRAVFECRAEHEPCDDWDGFVGCLWSSLTRVFAVDIDVTLGGEGQRDYEADPSDSRENGPDSSMP